MKNMPKYILSDEWAVGVLFYKLLSNGKHPFDVEAKSRQERIKITEETKKINVPRELFSSKGYPKAVEEIISGLL